MRRATIGIDCRLGGVVHGGIGRYIAEYLKRAIGYSDLNFSLVFGSWEQQRELLSSVNPTAQDRIHSRIARVQHYSLAEQVLLPTVFNNLNVDVLHVPHFNVPLGYRRPFVVTIHDLLWHSTRGTSVTTLPAWQYWLKYGAYQLTVRDTISRAARIFTPTQSVANTIKLHYPKAATKQVITYEGVGEQFVPAAQWRRVRKQLLYVGSLYPHKNVVVILDALLQLPTHTLIVVGARDVFTGSFIAEVNRRGLEDRVSIKSRVTDDQLVQLYQSCGAVIQPSTSEGFGLTGVEALACDTALIASDIPVFHEVYGDAAQFFDPHSSASLVSAIETIPHQETVALERARETALSRCSWDRMTKIIIDEIRTLI